MSSTKNIFLLLIIIILEISSSCNAAPLSTSSRWIVDQGTGRRVKLTCVNWVSHLQPMIAEGLEKKPLNYIAAQIAANGFNCVRFTWATFMFTRPDYFNLTVSQSLDKYNLSAAKSGFAEHNKEFLNMTIKEVHKAVVDELGKNNVSVVLDNHVSQPGWCCAGNDGNGFFGDPSFDPNEWLQGLAEVAKTYKNNSAVVGMSLRNELRGRRQNVTVWHEYMQQGANKIHDENPDFLVIVSGLYYDTILGFLKNKQLVVNLKNKLVYEAHWYAFGIPEDRHWRNQTNKVCAYLNQLAQKNYLFLTRGGNPFPLFVSEFGIDQSREDEVDERYITCLLSFMAENDIDWALWAFQGSYMLREGKVDLEETYGVMDKNWNLRPRNPVFLKRLQFVRKMNQVPISGSSNMTYNYKMFHPQSGQCVRVGTDNNVFLDNCENASRWEQHQDGGTIKLSGSSQCLEVVKDGSAASVSNGCSSKWKFVSSSGFHLAARINEQGEYFCLDTYNSTLVTKKCLCVGDDLLDLPICVTNPQVQWFKFVPTNVY